MKKVFLVLSLFLAVLSMSGCQKRYAYAAFRERIGEWVGKSSESLFDYWGKPDVIKELDPNTRTVTYYRREKRPAYYGFTPYLEKIKDTTAEVAEDMGYETEKKTIPSYYCRVTFVVHNNLVSEYDFDGDDCY